MKKVNWDDFFTATPSKNIRGEDTFDIFRTSTKEMLYSDIPVQDLDKIKKQMSDLLDHVATSEIEEVLGVEQQQPSKEPLKISYNRTKQYPSFGAVSFEVNDEETN